MRDRFKYYLREKGIRHDIIEAATNELDINQISIVFEKTKSLNKVATKQSEKILFLLIKEHQIFYFRNQRI